MQQKMTPRGALGGTRVGAGVGIGRGRLGAPAGRLRSAVLFWIGGFDLVCACQDVAVDRREGLYSVPARMGVRAALRLARGFHLVTVGALLALGWLAALGLLFYTGVACVALLLVVEHALVKPDDLRRVNLAFFTVNGVVGLVLGVLGILDIVLR